MNYLILFLHFVGDFILQSDKMACNKAKNFWYLLYHGQSYSLALLVGMFFGLSWEWVLWNTFAHIVVDYFTSKINAYLYPKSRHWFFVCIGFDQFMHVSLLLLTKGF